MNYYPPVGYSFHVAFLPNSLATGFGLILNGFDYNFKEVTGLTSSITADEYREGGVNDRVYHLPNPASYNNITLRRGLLVNSALGLWVQAAMERFEIYPMEMIISLLGPDHLPLIAWNVVGAYPIRSEISSFNSMQNEIVIESIELVCQKHRRIPLPTSTAYQGL